MYSLGATNLPFLFLAPFAAWLWAASCPPPCCRQECWRRWHGRGTAASSCPPWPGPTAATSPPSAAERWPTCGWWTPAQRRWAFGPEKKMTTITTHSYKKFTIANWHKIWRVKNPPSKSQRKTTTLQCESSFCLVQWKLLWILQTFWSSKKTSEQCCWQYNVITICNL